MGENPPLTAARVRRALAGGLGIVALIVSGAVASAGVLVALGLPAEGRADDSPGTTGSTDPTPTSPTTTTSTETTPGPASPQLVVALNPGDYALQAGVVRGRDVILARGLEVEVIRKVAALLGRTEIRFVYVGNPERLLSSRPGQWDLAIARLQTARSTTAQASYSAPYLSSDQVVLLRKGTSRPRDLAELRTRVLCAIKRTPAATAARGVGAEEPLLVAPGVERLMQLVQTGACDAAVLDPVTAARAIEGREAVVGGIAARIKVGTGYVVAVRREGAVRVPAVDRALLRLRVNGTLSALARQWIGVDPAALPVLR